MIASLLANNLLVSDLESIDWRNSLLLLSLSLGGDEGDDLVLLLQSTALGAESAAGEDHSALLLLLVSGSNHFHHLAFVGSQTADLGDHGTDGSNAWVKLTLAVGLLSLLGIMSSDSGHNETLVHTNVDTTLHQLLHHLVTLK